MLKPAVQIMNLRHRIGGRETLHIDQLSLPAGSVYALVGRNGAGKSTLLRTLANHVKPDKGLILINGLPLFENADAVSQVCLAGFQYSSMIRLLGDFTVKEMLDLSWRNWPNWQRDYSNELSEKFRIPLQKKLGTLSEGTLATLAAIQGLASGAEITLLDEITNGMDSVARETFYTELYKLCPTPEEILDSTISSGQSLDFSPKTRRTFILSTHLLSPGDLVFDRLLTLESGRIGLHESRTVFESLALIVTGPERKLAAVKAAGFPILQEDGDEKGQAKLLIVCPPRLAEGLDPGLRQSRISLERFLNFIIDRPGLWEHAILPFLQRLQSENIDFD